MRMQLSLSRSSGQLEQLHPQVADSGERLQISGCMDRHPIGYRYSCATCLPARFESAPQSLVLLGPKVLVSSVPNIIASCVSLAFDPGSLRCERTRFAGCEVMDSGNVPTQESAPMDAGQRTFEEPCSRFIGGENIKEEDRNVVNDMRNPFQSLNARLRNIENMMLPQASTPLEP